MADTPTPSATEVVTVTPSQLASPSASVKTTETVGIDDVADAAKTAQDILEEDSSDWPAAAIVLVVAITGYFLSKAQRASKRPKP